MFSGPRNISTTMMRAFENRPDTAVFDEPFYACYLEASGAEHPMRDEILAAQSASWDEVVNDLQGPLPKGALISFQKHIAFHFIDDAPLHWLEDMKVFHLIRRPGEMVASYKNKYDDVAPIVESLKVQRRIYETAIAQGAACPVVDAADILKNPAGMLRLLCRELDIPFTDDMLSWPKGARDSDGAWAPHWYDAVIDSTGFRPYEEREIDLPAPLAAIADACEPDFQFFHKRRLRLDA